jgi:dihydroorotase-like cyclic amidohydrolase
MSNLIKIVGMVDPHVHLRGMDWSHKGDFYTETCAAVAGGYWAVFDMPNTPPQTLDRASLIEKREKIASQAVCDWGLHFCAGANSNWDEYPAIYDLVSALKMFNNDTTGHMLIEDQTIRDGHFAHWESNKIFAQHAEGDTCREIIELVRKYRRRTHILHVSTAQEVAYIRQAKAEGLPLTAGVCPHHLWLTEDDLPRLGAFGWMKPVLKTQADQKALWEALQDGTIDIVESDHAPHTLAEKQSDKPPYGVTGLETTLPLLLTAYHEGHLTLQRVIDLVSDNPRQIYGIQCPPETYALVDLDAEYTITNENLHTAVKWSPFAGMKVRGKVLETWIRGVQVYDGENVLVPAGFGVEVTHTESVHE